MRANHVHVSFASMAYVLITLAAYRGVHTQFARASCGPIPSNS